MNIFASLFKGCRKVVRICCAMVNPLFVWVYVKGNGVKTGANFTSHGVPIIDVWANGSIVIGDNFNMNNGNGYNRIGRQQRCFFIARDGGQLIIGNNVGISSAAFFCSERIIIGNNVKIGGNTVIYDTDFHSLNYLDRLKPELDILNTKKARVKICDNVFIGAHSTILKGVEIGENSIIGACSVVTKAVPANEIWAGNPAKFIKKINI